MTNNHPFKTRRTTTQPLTSAIIGSIKPEAETLVRTVTPEGQELFMPESEVAHARALDLLMHFWDNPAAGIVGLVVGAIGLCAFGTMAENAERNARRRERRRIAQAISKLSELTGRK